MFPKANGDCRETLKKSTNMGFWRNLKGVGQKGLGIA